MPDSRFELVKTLALTGLVAAPNVALAMSPVQDSAKILLAGVVAASNVYSGLFTNILSAGPIGAKVEAVAGRNHLLRRGMSAALLEAIRAVDFDPEVKEKPPAEFYQHWRMLLKATASDDDLLAQVIPIKFYDDFSDRVLFESDSESELEGSEGRRDAAAALAAFLRGLLDVNAKSDASNPLGLDLSRTSKLLAIWNEDESAAFAEKVLPHYLRFFASDVNKGGPLQVAFGNKLLKRIFETVRRQEVKDEDRHKEILVRFHSLEAVLEAIRAQVSLDPYVLPKYWKKPEIFLGRDKYLEEMSGWLLRDDPRPVFVHGLFGVGKSALCEEFASRNRAYFECGGYARITLEPGREESLDSLLKRVAEKFGVEGKGESLESLLPARFDKIGKPTLLHIENVDWHEAGQAVSAVRQRIGKCRLIVSGRLGGIGGDNGWQEIALKPFQRQEALDQLASEYRLPQNPEEKITYERLVEQCGYLPQAIHLCAGHLKAGMDVALILEQLPMLGPIRDSDPLYEQRARAFLDGSFDLSWQLFETECQRSKMLKWPEGLSAFAAAPLSGAGESLGSSVCALSCDEFTKMMSMAESLSIVAQERVYVDGETLQSWAFHSLIRELIKDKNPRTVRRGRTRLSNWFMKRISAGGESLGEWREVDREQAALVEWLDSLGSVEAQAACARGQTFAELRGPWRAWARAAMRGFEHRNPFDGWACAGLVASETLFQVGDLDRSLQIASEIRKCAKENDEDKWVACAAGLVANVRVYQEGRRDEALTARNEQLAIYERMQRKLDKSTVLCEIAHIHYLSQEFQAALDILQRCVLPMLSGANGFEELRLEARTHGQIAEVYYSRGDLGQALDIRREEQLPINERLADTREMVMTQIAIADILCRLGFLEKAFELHTEQLRIIEKLGDNRIRAIVGYGIAHILFKQGHLQEAITLLRSQVLPIFDWLGDVREKALTESKLAVLLAELGRNTEANALCADRAIPALERLGVQASLARAQFRWARVKAADNRKEEAIELAQKTLVKADRLGLQLLASEVRRFLQGEFFDKNPAHV